MTSGTPAGLGYAVNYAAASVVIRESSSLEGPLRRR